VFSKGTATGLKVLIPLGGQMLPISIVGARLAAKKGSEESKEKHNLRNYKQNHTVS
jgi:hypothetical protein